MQRPQPPKLVAVALLCADIKSHLIIANFTFTVKDAEVGARQRGDELFAELVQRPIAPMTPAANDDDELRKRREAAEPLPLWVVARWYWLHRTGIILRLLDSMTEDEVESLEAYG